MPNSSLAALFHDAHRPLTLERYDLPALGPGEVLVRVTCSTLCGSDVHTFLGHRSTPVPTVLGHEIVGLVEQLDSKQPARDFAGRPLQVGDRITWSIAASCGACFFCENEVPQKCERLFKYGHEKAVSNHPLSGGLAEHCHLAAGTAIFRLPSSLADRVACPANCATATAAAAMRIAGSCQGKTVLIQGAGMLGLTAAAMANKHGARAVLVCDIDSERLEQSLVFGATHTLLVSADAQQLVDQVKDLTAGRGVDVAIEMSGAAGAAESGVKLPRIGGRYVLIGNVSPTAPIAIDPEMVVRRCLTITGNHNYRPEDLEQAVEFLSQHAGHFPFAELVYGDFTLPDVQAAFARASERQDLRVAVTPGQ